MLSIADPWLGALAFLGALLLLERGAEWFTESAAVLAVKARAPQVLVGLLTAGGEWEELAVVVIAAASGNVGVAVGDVVGSVIANIAGSFPLAPLLRPFHPGPRDRWLVLLAFVITAAVGSLLASGPLGAGHGAALVGGFVVYLVVVLALIVRGASRPLSPDPSPEDELESGSGHGWWRAILTLLLGLLLILIGAELAVSGAVAIARALGLSEFVIGLTLVAIGTTMPDKVISLVGGAKGQSGLVVGGLAGSNIFNLLLVLGIGALVTPLGADGRTRAFDIPVMIGLAAVVCVPFFFPRRAVGRFEAVLLLVVYIAYIAVNLTIGLRYGSP